VDVRDDRDAHYGAPITCRQYAYRAS
jgi:hypothetical protein